ncbi:unnamed protein product [Caenorhabditis angaria]|uniref:Uncharacterized protein n=1 Tax=Caenorhabditis angaria TaxID=860376 RepID=A0A9P1IKA2_9PELO|nr:unnamed protein product [Caenorhabditis angaria]
MDHHPEIVDNDEDDDRCSTPVESERSDSRASTIIASEYGTPVKSVTNSIYNVELERLENQNSEYRDKLLKTIRERDLNEELLKNVRGQHQKELESHLRRIRDLEIQLKATSDKSSAQEAHFNVTTREMSQKYNTSVQQLTRKADQNEKEKNEAVVKYAMREGEMMKIKEEIVKKESALKQIQDEINEMKRCQAQENVEELEKNVNNLKVEVEKLKHEKFDAENRLKMAEKRVEGVLRELNEAKKEGDVLRKQLIQSKDDKMHSQNLEREKRENELEKKIKEMESDLERMRASQLDMATKFEEASRENMDLLSKIDILQDQLSLEEDRRKLCEEQIERLKGVENFVVSSTNQVEESQKEKNVAEMEKEQAEIEAEECRKHAENMLKLTQVLTEKNAELQQNIVILKEEHGVEIENVKKDLELLRTEIEAKNEEIEELRASSRILPVEAPISRQISVKSEDTDNYFERYEEVLKLLEAAEIHLTEEKNSLLAYKKKSHATIKELKSELATFRKSSNSQHELSAGGVQGNGSDSAPSMSSRSRASSITSIDRVTSISREEDGATTAQEEALKIEKQQQQNVQQTMIDKIVVLQRKLARRTEKCEFLEEHVRQCLEELQKKTKIIQHFALREEASLLMPAEGSIEKLFGSCEFVQVPIVKKSTAYALMGAMFVNSGSEKKQSQILTEVNSRLQAVLEDQIQKNINMRTTVDQLTTENTKLCRENRLLTLSQARFQDP